MKKCRNCKNYMKPKNGNHLLLCGFNDGKVLCEKYETAKDCRNCKYLDYSDLKACHFYEYPEFPEYRDSEQSVLNKAKNTMWGYVCNNFMEG